MIRNGIFADGYKITETDKARMIQKGKADIIRFSFAFLKSSFRAKSLFPFRHKHTFA